MLLLSSCAGMMLKPMEQKYLSTTTIQKIDMDKEQAFNSTLSYLAKNIQNSTHAIRLKDKEQGKIIAKIGTNCKGLKRPDVIIHKPNLAGVEVGGNFIAQAKGQDEAVKSCNKQLISDIIKGIKENHKDNQW